MYNPEYIQQRICSRVIILNYALNDHLTLHADVVEQMFQDINKGCDNQLNSYDLAFVERIVVFFRNNASMIHDFVACLCRSQQLDQISFALLHIAVAELLLRPHHQHIIRDYLKIADMYNISHRLINAVLSDSIQVVTNSLVTVVSLLTVI
jgi:transcription termination factor NusB